MEYLRIHLSEPMTHPCEPPPPDKPNLAGDLHSRGPDGGEGEQVPNRPLRAAPSCLQRLLQQVPLPSRSLISYTPSTAVLWLREYDFPVQVVLGEVLEGAVGEGRLRLRVGQVPGLPLGKMKAATFLCGGFGSICDVFSVLFVAMGLFQFDNYCLWLEKIDFYVTCLIHSFLANGGYWFLYYMFNPFV